MGHASFAVDAIDFGTKDGLLFVSGLAENDVYFTPHAFLVALNKAHRVYDEWARKQCSVLLPACKGCERIGERDH